VKVSWRRLRSVRRRWWVVALVLIATTVTGLVWQGRGSSATEAQTTVATVSVGDYETTVSATGTITPKRQEDLSFAVSGEVTKVAVKAGDRVGKGDLLARIDATTLRAQRDAARSSVDAAETQRGEDEDDDATDTQLAADEASLAAARSQLTSAQESVDDATLRAPMTGTVSAVNLEVGDQAGAGTSAASADGTSTADITVISTNSFVVEATVGSSDVDQLKKGLQAEITPTAATDTVYGTVAEVGRIAGADSSGAATFPVTIDVTGTPKGLYAGSSADVSIVVAKVTDVLTVPSQALHTDNGETYVYVVDGDARRRTVVKTGTAYGPQTEVLSGLQEGDKVEIQGFSAPGGGTTQQGELPNGFTPPSGAFPQDQIQGNTP
jgi:RND family efflux transporter MFP subunit